MACSLVGVQARRAFPVRVAQGLRSAAEKAASKAKAAAQPQPPSPAPRRLGRPQGSKHTPQADVTLTPAWSRLTAMRDAWRHLIARSIPLTSLGLDGHFGNHNALHLARQSHLHLMSKLRGDAALSFPYTGP